MEFLDHLGIVLLNTFIYTLYYKRECCYHEKYLSSGFRILGIVWACATRSDHSDDSDWFSCHIYLHNNRNPVMNNVEEWPNIPHTLKIVKVCVALLQY